jgi:hypothetical protein
MSSAGLGASEVSSVWQTSPTLSSLASVSVSTRLAMPAAMPEPGVSTSPSV